MVARTRTGFAVGTLASGALLCGVAGIALGADGGNASRGETRAAELFCNICHGPAGNSVTPQWPVLAGQQVDYLVEQLTLFRLRQRTNIEMGPLAAMLTDADIVDLAAYYAAQTPAPGEASAPGGGDTAASRLYADGDAAREIVACASCHGSSGQGVIEPAQRGTALRGQQAAYITKQLQDYAARSRYTKNGATAEQMSVISAKLTAEEMTSLGTLLQRMR
ncbi:MAG: c-type cytochrome [Steroidobacteraceae bacterium]